MNVLLVALGSSGDVNPIVGIGGRLRARGHEVTVVGDPTYRETVAGAGLGFEPVGEHSRYEALARGASAGGFRQDRPGTGGLAFVDQTRSTFEAIAKRFVPRETVLVGPTFTYGARIAHDKLGVPLVTLHSKATSCFRGPDAMPRMRGVLGSRLAPAFYRRWLYGRLTRRLDRSAAGPVNRARRDLGLPPVDHVMTRWRDSPQCLIGMFPSWFAGTTPPWPDHFHFAGFPRLGDTASMPDELDRFLAQRPSPIVFSASTVTTRGGSRFVRAALAYCRQTGERAILLTKFLDREQQEVSSSQVLHVPHAPLETTLSRARAVVHFGGIGTVAQALRAGIPQVVVPYLPFEQLDNATRLEAMGVARHLEPRDLSARTLHRAISSLLRSQSVTERCRALARRVESEDGFDRAADIIEGIDPRSAARAAS